MNMRFTDEMKLIIENWDVVRDIHTAEESLRRQLQEILYSLEVKLEKQAWWDSAWKFDRYKDVQVFITNQEWIYKNQCLIWIGVENFTVKSIFGEEGNASLYVWVEDEHKQLTSNLRDYLQTLPSNIGEIESKGNNSYVVRQPLRKCLPEELENFDDIIIKPILEFMSYYASHKESFTEIFTSVDKSSGE